MLVVWIILSAFAVFVVFHVVRGFLEGLGIRRRTRLKVIGLDDDQQEGST